MSLDLADKWLSGKLTLPDVADYSAEVSARLASDPFKFLQAVSKTEGRWCMTKPNTPLQQQVAAAEQVIGQVGALWAAAADQSDSAEGLGIDGRIQLVHGLVDLWVKGYVAWLEALHQGRSVSYLDNRSATEPLPSEFVLVAPRPYLRKVEVRRPVRASRAAQGHH